MATTRSRKRAASSDGEAQPDPPKRTRQTKKTAPKVDPEDDDEDDQVSNAPKASPKSGAKITKSKVASPDSKTKKASPKGKGKKAATAVDDGTTASTAQKPTAKAKGKKAVTVADDNGTATSTNQQSDTKVKRTNAPIQDDAKDAKDQHKQNEQDVKKNGDNSLTPIEAESQSTQFAKAEHLVIPVDEHFSGPGYCVYVDHESRIIYDASLNQTNASNNNNKFYKIQVLTNGKGQFTTWTRWGRVGEAGQSANIPAPDVKSAISTFEKKFKDKAGLKWAERSDPPKTGKYCFIERSYEESDNEGEEKNEESTATTKEKSASPPPSGLDPAVQSLIKFMFDQDHFNSTMADMNYDAAKLPLGKLSKATMKRGYETLKELAALIDDESLAGSKYNKSYPVAVEALSNQFYSYIPHAFGRDRPPIIRSFEILKKEVQLMESLTDLKDADAILKSNKLSKLNILDARYKGLGMREMTPVENDTQEFLNISQYLTETRGSSHNIKYNVMDIFRIEREGEQNTFKTMDKDKSDRKLLWHGSRSTNFGGILSQGLRIAPPEAPVSGYMFGKGVYLADMSSKSANYCYPHISGGQALLLLCEAELGNPIQELVAASYTAGDDAIAKGMLSTWGKGQTGPKGWKDAECVHPSLKGVKMPDTQSVPGNTNVDGAYLLYNEYICYDVSQIRLRYLLRVKV